MITYIQRGDTLDYTPDTDTPAGTPVKLGDIVGITKLDIKAGELGAIALTGIYEAPKAAGEQIAAGTPVGYNPATGEVAATPSSESPFPIGVAVAAADAADLTVRFLLGF